MQVKTIEEVKKLSDNKLQFSPADIKGFGRQTLNLLGIQTECDKIQKQSEVVNHFGIKTFNIKVDDMDQYYTDDVPYLEPLETQINNTYCDGEDMVYLDQ